MRRKIFFPGMLGFLRFAEVTHPSPLPFANAQGELLTKGVLKLLWKTDFILNTYVLPCNNIKIGISSRTSVIRIAPALEMITVNVTFQN